MRLWTGLMAAVVLLVVLSPGLLYAWGLHQAFAYPTPAAARPAAAQEAWLRCGEKLPIQVERTNPWAVAYAFVQGSTGSPPRVRQPAGLRMAELVAMRQGPSWHGPMNMARYHAMSTAMGIWIVRHWTAEQIAETAAAEDVCQRSVYHFREG